MRGHSPKNFVASIHRRRIEACKPLYRFLGRTAEAYQWVDEIYLAVVAEEHIVAVGTYIRYGHNAIAEEVPILSDEPLLCQRRNNLRFRRKGFRQNL